MITAQNIIQHELIGLDAEIIKSHNKQIQGLNGTIIDETKSMFHIHTKIGVKMIPKSHNTWKFFLPSEQVTVSGVILSRRPQDRLRTKL